MHVLVLGAGVVGTTTAYYLSQLGCRVTVIDRASDVGDGASFANAGQLSYSFTDALAKPEFLASIPGILLGRDPGSRVCLTPGLISWGLRFLGQCTTKRAEHNTVAVLKTAMRSAELMTELRERAPFEFSHRQAGKLVLLSDEAELNAATGRSRLKNAHGSDTRILSRDEVITIEPALERISSEFIAAVYSQNDEVADSLKFTTGLRKWLEEDGMVTFRLSSTAKKIVVKRGRAHAVVVDDDTIEADAVVVCMGAWSSRLLRTIGINPHIYPMRGYSITLPSGEASPSVSVTVLKHRIVFSNIDGFIRIAGFADFAGFDTSADAERTRLLLEFAKRVAPDAASYDSEDAHAWGGFRPMTPSGQPLVGATGIRGLFLNTGHGMLGWTLACSTGYGAAQAVARTH
jgi:D-amino-acid dehydrogenase